MRYLLGIVTGICLSAYTAGLILAAYLERGYIAAGGEWLLITIGGIGLFGCGYKLRDWQARESKRRVSKLKAQINDFLY